MRNFCLFILDKGTYSKMKDLVYIHVGASEMLHFVQHDK